MPSLPGTEVEKIYRLMVLARVFDERALSLQREGRIGTYASILGQEASQVGSAFAISAEDWVFPSYRESGVFIALGYPLFMLFQFWSGDERGARSPDGLNIFPVCIPVGTHLLHAAGAALAMKYREQKCATIAFFGDGATSKGDFHEAMNMAGVFKTPSVFVCQNNQWAISVPRSRQTASETIARKAFAYGFEGTLVDGNDVFAVYRAVNDALVKARAGGGPTLIECFTYRISDHTTADDASRYRSEEEVAMWKKKDPLLRLASYMKNKGMLPGETERKIESGARSAVDEAVKKAESVPPPELDPQKNLFGYTYQEPAPRQKKELKEFLHAGH